MWASNSTGRLCDIYNREALKTEIDSLTEENAESATTIEQNKTKIQEVKNQLDNDTKSKDILLSSKQKIDDTLLNVNVTTIETRMENISNEGKKINTELTTIEKEIEEYGEIEFSDEDYEKLAVEKEKYSNAISTLKAEMKAKKAKAESLANDEYCPTCHQKWPDRDNSQAIAALQAEYAADIETGIQYKAKYDEVASTMSALEENRRRYFAKSQKEIKLGVLKNERDTLRNEYKDLKKIAEAYKDNKDAITKNNEIDAQVNVLKTNIETYNSIIRRLENENVAMNKDIETNNATIREKESYIKRIEQEIETEKTWRLYLQMVGKDGIAKMVLKVTVPKINEELDRLLCDVADFKVEVDVNDKNDIDFWLIRDDVKTRLAGGSGLERTMAALALRVTLGKMSNLSRPPFIVLDEILGSVAAENYDDMKKLYDKIADDYDFILHICHIDLDWYEKTVLVTKQSNISTISVD